MLFSFPSGEIVKHDDGRALLAAHKKLEELLESNQYPDAECRVEGDEIEIWSGPKPAT